MVRGLPRRSFADSDKRDAGRVPVPPGGRVVICLVHSVIGQYPLGGSLAFSDHYVGGAVPKDL